MFLHLKDSNVDKATGTAEGYFSVMVTEAQIQDRGGSAEDVTMASLLSSYINEDSTFSSFARRAGSYSLF